MIPTFSQTSKLSDLLMSEYPIGLGGKAQNSGEERIASGYGSCKMLKVKNTNRTIHPHM
jgi:hypothetical protein